MRWLAALLAFALPLHFASAQTSSCDAYLASSEVQDTQDLLRKLSALPRPIWGQYRLENHTIILTDSRAYPGCAVVIDKMVAVKVDLESPVSFLNGMYEFYFSPVLVNFPKALKAELERRGTVQALVYNTDRVFLDKLLGHPTEFEKHLKGYDTLHHHVMIHEGLHIFAQFPKWFGKPNYEWPSWDKQPDRGAVTQLCYQAPNVKRIYEKEHKVLLSTFKLLFIFERPDLAKQAAREFLQVRQSRYLLLTNTTVPSRHDPKGISCAHAEAIMELEEGVADFVGNGTRMLIGELSPRQIAEASSMLQESSFYDFGFLQMMTIYGLKSSEIDSITSRIANSMTWTEGIAAEFALAVQ